MLILILLAAVVCAGCGLGGGKCAVMKDFPDRDEIALTPRANLEAEVLALRCSDGFVADEDLYARIDADLAAIRAADARMQGITDYFAQPLDADLDVEVEDADALADFITGRGGQFTCVTEELGGEILTFDEDSVRVDFAGVYELFGLADFYATLHDVRGASANSFIGDGDRVSYDHDSMPPRYLFEAGGGDCPSGCTTHVFHLWELPTDGAPVLVAEWDTAASGEPPSGFRFEDFDCR